MASLILWVASSCPNVHNPALHTITVRTVLDMSRSVLDIVSVTSEGLQTETPVKVTKPFRSWNVLTCSFQTETPQALLPVA